MKDTPGNAPSTPHERLATVLLVLATLFFCLCLLLAAGWYLAWKQGSRLDIGRLSPNQAQTLVQQYLDRSPSVLRYAFFEPKIGYTLTPNTRMSVWGDTFSSNGLGYREGPVPKAADTYRVLFVGDSWAYGMGVTLRESFPHQFAAIANNNAGLEKQITAWNLSLPGYNAINELAALEAFFDLLEPDAVVLCPTTNDIDGTKKVNLAGNLQIPKRGEWQELFLDWRSQYLDSYLNQKQWEETFGTYSLLARRLSAKGIPFFLFFSADWLHEPVVHDLMVRANVQAPYAIVPREFLTGKWRRQEIYGHGTPAAYTVFARIIYHMVATELGWRQLREQIKTRDGSEVAFYAGPPPGNWAAESKPILKGRVVPSYDFEPGAEHSVQQVMSGVDWKTGVVSSNPGLVLLRRKAGATRLRLRLKPLPRARFLYPLEVTVTIPSRSGGVRVTGQLSEDGEAIQTIEMDLPPDIEPGSGIDVIIETERSVLDMHFIARSFYLVGIEQV